MSYTANYDSKKEKEVVTKLEHADFVQYHSIKENFEGNIEHCKIDVDSGRYDALYNDLVMAYHHLCEITHVLLLKAGLRKYDAFEITAELSKKITPYEKKLQEFLKTHTHKHLG